MYGYFRAFYDLIIGRNAERRREAARAAAAATQS